MPLDERDEMRLRDMMTWSLKAIHILDGKSYQDMLANEEKHLALVRCLEIIGEAGHQVSPGVQTALPAIPWPAMWGMRNRLIHDYGNTNYLVVYDVVTLDLPSLVAALASFLAANDG